MLGEFFLQLMVGSSVVVALGKPRKRSSVGSIVSLRIVCMDEEWLRGRLGSVSGAGEGSGSGSGAGHLDD